MLLVETQPKELSGCIKWVVIMIISCKSCLFECDQLEQRWWDIVAGISSDYVQLRPKTTYWNVQNKVLLLKMSEDPQFSNWSDVVGGTIKSQALMDVCSNDQSVLWPLAILWNSQLKMRLAKITKFVLEECHLKWRSQKIWILWSNANH